MAEDSVLVSLIARSVLADTLLQRRAAEILVEILRLGEDPTNLEVRLEGVVPNAGMVISEVRTLMAQYRLSDKLQPNTVFAH
jgi:hypothetical protein